MLSLIPQHETAWGTWRIFIDSHIHNISFRTVDELQLFPSFPLFLRRWFLVELATKKKMEKFASMRQNSTVCETITPLISSFYFFILLALDSLCTFYTIGCPQEQSTKFIFFHGLSSLVVFFHFHLIVVIFGLYKLHTKKRRVLRLSFNATNYFSPSCVQISPFTHIFFRPFVHLS